MPKHVPRQRKHKVLARQKAQEGARHEVDDTNQEILPANGRSEGRKSRVKKELGHEGDISEKKAKRLEKYIDGKLRKDENRQLLANLAQQRVDTSLFASSRALGAGKETKKQRLGRALREKNAGLDGDETVLYEERPELDDIEDGNATDEDDPASNELPSIPEPIVEVSSTSAEPSAAPAAGSGLKRPLELDDDGRPVIPKRQKRGGVKSKFTAAQINMPPPSASEDEEDESASDSEESDSDEWGGLSDDERTTTSVGQEPSKSDEEVEDSSSNTSSDGSSDETSEDEDDDDDDNDRSSPKVSGFKAWAIAQRNKAQGFQPTEESTTNMTIPKPDNFVPRAPEQEPLPDELKPTQGVERKAFSVAVDRSPEIQEARMKLPVVAEEQRLMEAIHNNDVVVICGATGSGKTTQVPQFLFEAGFGSPDGPTPGMIGVTQPRRVAAVSMSKRVSEELGDQSDKVAYQIRFEGNVGSDTAVKFMTDGVLLRELANDLTLSKYSAIVIDEAHERSVNTDILIGMLSRVVRLKQKMKEEGTPYTPLKLIIMSATLRIEDLTQNKRLFERTPPVIDVEGRQHPVTVHFSRRTTMDYVEEAFRKIRRGHKKLPPGGFLVFLTGRNEITQLSRRLKEDMGGLKTAEAPKVRIPANEAPTEAEDIEFGDGDDRFDDEVFDDLPDIEDDEEEEEKEFEIEDDDEAAPLKMQVLPLYSLLPTKEQMRVFDAPPEGTRQIILATNVAETSLTIPGTRYVFDCGRSKERQYDPITGVQSYQIGWISKASASQRSGRAGRTGPGHCYRLYSSAVFERDFEDFAAPEIMRMPLEGVALQLKSMNLRNVINFPFPTPPDTRMLARAEKVLTYLSAISSVGKITEVGQAMTVFPLAPRYARILLVGHAFGCLQYTIAMVAGLSAQEVFIPENQAVPEETSDNMTFRTQADVQAEDRRTQIRKHFREVHQRFTYLDDRSDAIKLLQVVGEFAHEPWEAWAENHYVRFKILKEIQQLRKQITELLRANMEGFKNLRFEEKLDAPDAKQVAALKQMAAAGFLDQIAIRGDLAPTPPETRHKPRRPIDVPYVPLQPLPRGEEDADQCVYIHPSSVLAHISTQECPQYIVYSYLQESTPAAAQEGKKPKKPKTRMHALTDVSGGQITTLARGTPLLTYGKPIKEWNLSTDKTDGHMTREAVVVPYLRAENTVGQGWPLPAKKVKQKKIPGQGWVVI